MVQTDGVEPHQLWLVPISPLCSGKPPGGLRQGLMRSDSHLICSGHAVRIAGQQVRKQGVSEEEVQSLPPLSL